MSFEQPVGIAGVGLIGGSIALRAREAGLRVAGFDRDSRANVRAFVDIAAASLEDLAMRSGTLVLALPLDATLEAIDVLRRMEPKASLILDVASVKRPVVERARGWRRFVATHPIAGSERTGAAHARADLFEGRTWTYVPAAAGDESQTGAARSFIEAMGGRPIEIGEEEHDRMLALSSHLPQVVASVLGAVLAEREIRPELAGPGLASTLRLAGSPWPLWETILRANGAVLAPAVRDVAERLAQVADELTAGELQRTASSFESANRAYEKLARENAK